MTREEAVKWVKFVHDVLYEDKDEEIREALNMAIEALHTQEPRGVYQCFHCGSYSVVWGADFDFSDYGYDGEGVVHSCHCTNCGAEIEYKVPIPDEEDEDASQKS